MKLYLMLALTVVSILINPIYADEMITDKTNYYSGDIVTVFGTTPYKSQQFNFYFTSTDTSNVYSGYGTTDFNGNFLFTNPHDLYFHTGHYEISAIMSDLKLTTYVNYMAESESPFEIKTDKAEYYKSQEILITGITNIDQIKSQNIDFDFYYSNGTKMELDYGIAIQSNNSFDSTIYTDGTPWDNYTGYVIVNATVSEFWNTTVFHYTNEPDMTKETTYYRTINNEDRLNNNDENMQNIRDELVVLNGYVGGITNPTLDSEFPLILNQNDARKVSAEINRLEEAIAKTEVELNQTMIQLTDALADNNPSKIEKFTKNVGSYIALNELRKAALNMINIYVEIYS